MAYMGINDYTNIISNYVTPVIPHSANVSELQDISTKEVTPEVQAVEVKPVDPISEGAVFRVKNIDIHDVALKFNANDDFNYIGRDVDIKNLDMQKAVSDMQKDGILSQYQFFVGTKVGL